MIISQPGRAGTPDPGASRGGQLELFPQTGSQHAYVLHPPKSRGWVVVGRKTLPRREQWVGYHPWELDFLMWDRRGERDLYMTQNRFRRPSQALHQLGELVAFYSDLDYYNVESLKGLAPEAVLQKALGRLEEAGIPLPSLALSSGQGIYLVWPLAAPLAGEELRSKLPRWNQCQTVLYGVLKGFGADRNALDASRVLRVVGSVNSKNGEPVQPLGDLGPRWSFEELAERILPLEPTLDEGSAEVFDLAAERAARRPEKSKTGKPGPNGWTVPSLLETRLLDLRTLKELRFGDGAMTDYRDRWLYVAASTVARMPSWSPAKIETEVRALAYEACGWDAHKAEHYLRFMKSVFKRVEMYHKGETVEYAGEQEDPRYKASNPYIIQLLEITADEERHMKTIISGTEKYRRKVEKRAAAAEAQREAGVMSRGERAAWRRSEARRMAEEGRTFSEIAEALGVSEHSVNSYIYGRR